MIRVLTIAALAGALLIPSTANAARPPSFALWTARWGQEMTKAIDVPIVACAKSFGGQTNSKAGACAFHAVREAWKTHTPRWEHQVATIARGQTRACRVAIHAYWLASHKAQAATRIYLEASHPGVTILQISVDLNAEPYSTLKSLTDQAKSHAIRVCG